MSDEKMLNKIRALLAKAEATTFEHEAEAYTSRALQLMAKYGIDEARARQQDPQARVTAKTIRLAAPFRAQRGSLLTAIGEPMGCRVVVMLPNARKEPRVAHVIGYPSDVERVVILFESLLIQANRFMATTHMPRRAKAKFRRDWLHGFAAMVRTRIEEWNALTTVQEGPGTDLVLRDRDETVNAALAATFPSIRPAPVQQAGIGFLVGAHEARRADLGRTALTPGGQQ